LSEGSDWSEYGDSARLCLRYAYEDLHSGNLALAYNAIVAALDYGDIAYLMRSRRREVTYEERSALSDFHFQAVHRLSEKAPAQFRLEPF